MQLSDIYREKLNNVFVTYTVGVPPKILEPLNDVTVVAPNDAILECDLDLGEPESEIKW